METTDSRRRERHRHGRNDSSENQRPLRKENKGSHDAASPSCSSSSAVDARFSPSAGASAGRELLRLNSPGRNGLHNKGETERKRRRHSDSGSPSRSSSPRYRPRSPGGEEEKSVRRRHEYRASPHRQGRSSRSRSSEPKGTKGVQKKERSESPHTSEHGSCASPSSHSPRFSESRPASLERKIPSSARKEKQRHGTRACSGSSNSTRRSSSGSTILAGGAVSCREVAFDENADQAAAAPPQMEQSENSFFGPSVCMPSAFLRREKKRGGFCGALARLKALRHEEDFMYADFTSAGQREAATSTLLPEGAPAAEVAAADTSSAAETGAAAAGANSREEHQEQPRLATDEKAAGAVRKRAITTAKDGAEAAPTERPATAAAAGRRHAAESCASVSNEGDAGTGTSEGAAPSVLQQQHRQRSLHSKGGEQQQQGGTQGEGNGYGISGKEKEGDEDEVLLEVEEEEEAAEVVRSMRELQKARQTRWIRKGLDVKSMEEKENAAAAVEEEDELAGYGLLEKSFSAVSNAAGLTYDKHLEEFLRERMQLKEVQSNSTPAQQEQEGQGQQNNVMPSTEDLYRIPEHLQVPDRSNDLREQLNWLTGLTEVPLPLSAKLKNIEATEKAKRALLKKGKTGETLDDEDDPDVVRRKAFGLRYTWFDPDRRQRARAGDDRALQLFSQKGRRAQQMRGRVGIGFG